MNFTKQQLIFLGAVGVIIIVFLVIFFTGGRDSAERINLTIWGVDDQLAWDSTIYQYQRSHSNVRLQYVEIRPENYEEELIDALAANKGPDIFMFSNHWLAKHNDKISPLPPEKMTLAAFSTLFPKVAEKDLMSEGKIYALPLSIDTLALFYNRDIFDNRGVASPPKTWDEFLAAISKIRSIERSGNLALPTAAAIGGSLSNISHAVDILTLSMLQVGATELDDRTGVTRLLPNTDAGGNALEFYTRFTKPKDPYYTWNDSFKSSIDSFAEGKTAMIFAYAEDVPEIKSKNPFLDFAIEPAPQADLNQAVSVASYWALSVSSRSQNSGTAWDFAVFATTESSTARKYIEETSRPPALRSLINEYLNDLSFGTFAKQALTARSVYQDDHIIFKTAFNRAIEKMMSGNDIREVLESLEVELKGPID